MQHETLTVGLGDRAYDIVIGPDLIDRTGSILGPVSYTHLTLPTKA